MELHLHSHHWERRLPDWAMAAASGFLAGAVLMVLELLWATAVSGTGTWTIPHMVAALVMGPSVLESNGFDLSVVTSALVTHYALGILFGMILAAIIAPFHLDSSAPTVLVTGALFGLVIYLFNFYGMERIFPWFATLRGWEALTAHIVFGMVTAVIYWKLKRPELER
jgi:hypothetical protein